MHRTASFLTECIQTLPSLELFPLIDLLRLMVLDKRASGWMAEDGVSVFMHLLERLNRQSSDCPFQLRLVTLQSICNMFSTPLFPLKLLAILHSTANEFIITSLEDTHLNIRLAATSVVFNIACFIQNHQRNDKVLDYSPVEMTVALLHALQNENKSSEVVKGIVLALAFLIYRTEDEELCDLLKALDAAEIVRAKMAQSLVEDIPELKYMCEEVGNILLSSL